MAVVLLIEKLKQVLIQDAIANLFSDEVEKLYNHLHRFKALSKRSGDGETRLIRRIRDLVYEAEDAIDAYITQKNPVNDHPPVNVVTTKVEKVGALLEQIIRRIDAYVSSDSEDSEDGGTAQIYQTRRQNVVVGMEYETEEFTKELMEELDELEVLSIVGMAGLGKTALVHKIFHDARIVQHFSMRMWVYVSQAFTPKEIFFHILNYFTLLTDDIKSKTDKELADVVVGFLENERFLLVMDDLRSPEDWDRLKVALPMSNEKGRVLITSRSMEVGWHVNSSRYPYHLRFLTQDEGFQLLHLEALRGQRLLSTELNYLLRVIARKCCRHPLAIVLVGGILCKEKEFSSDMQTMKAA